MTVSKALVLLSFFAAAAANADEVVGGRVLETMQKAGCPACHATGGLASKTRLQVPADTASAEQMKQFVNAARRLVDSAQPERSLLLLKPTFRTTHAGGRLIEPNSEQEVLLRQWVQELAALGPVGEPTEPEPAAVSAAQMLRRLTHSQYNNTVRDLLGDYSRIADRFPPEDFVNGFKNQVQAQDIPPLLAEAYSDAAEKLARNAFRGGDRKGLIPCEPVSARDARCAEVFIRSLGGRAFRRPLEASETELYLRLFAAGAEDSGEFLDGARLVLEAMLQSPKFLFHLEPGPNARRTAYARANRLSYFLWNTLPDEELLVAAESGGLDSLDGVREQARRMLDDVRARESADEFFAQWLRYDLTLNAVRDRRLYRDFSPELAANMVEETRRLIDDIAWNDRDFREILTAGHTYLSSDLAKLYGLSAPEQEFARVELPHDSPRAGLLGRASFLTMTSKPGETSPTMRGLFVREHLLCEKVPDPPPDASATLPPLSEDKPLANRDLLSAHLTKATCAGCHKLIDSVGFGLEMYDAVGQGRERQSITFFPSRAERKKDPVTVEVEIDPTGIISGISEKTFSSPRELGEILSESEQCQECMVRQLFRYATGRMEEERDRADMHRVVDAFRNSGFRFRELLTAMAASDAFLGGPSDATEAGSKETQ